MHGEQWDLVWQPFPQCSGRQELVRFSGYFQPANIFFKKAHLDLLVGSKQCVFHKNTFVLRWACLVCQHFLWKMHTPFGFRMSKDITRWHQGKEFAPSEWGEQGFCFSKYIRVWRICYNLFLVLSFHSSGTPWTSSPKRGTKSLAHGPAGSHTVSQGWARLVCSSELSNHLWFSLSLFGEKAVG